MRHTRFISSILIVAAFAGIIAGCNKTSGETTVNTAASAAATSGYTSVRNPDGTLPNKGKIGDIEYQITEQNECQYMKKRGYFIDTLDQPNSPYFIFICSGEKSTGGYDVRVVDIATDASGKWLITVEETSPAADAMVTEAFTYPCCVIEVNKVPDEIQIVSTTGAEFDCV